MFAADDRMWTQPSRACRGTSQREVASLAQLGCTSGAAGHWLINDSSTGGIIIRCWQQELHQGGLGPSC
jgi:hypothetical protein